MPLPSENNATLAPLIHSQEYHPQTGRGLTHEALERLELDRWPCVTFSEVRNNFLGFVWAKCATASCVSCPRHGPGKGFFRVLKHHADMQNMDPGATRAAVCSAAVNALAPAGDATSSTARGPSPGSWPGAVVTRSSRKKLLSRNERSCAAQSPVSSPWVPLPT